MNETNYLEKLFPELLNGVEYKKLGECCEVLDTKRKPISKTARESGIYPYYGANGIQDYVSNYIFDGTFVLVGEDGSVLTKNGNPVVNWAKGKIWVNNHAHIIAEKQGFLLRYLFHFLQTVNITDLVHGNIPKLTQGDFRNLEIPVPPLKVQAEIVRILDKFTALEEELEEELEARCKQYEYYRNSLLTFGEDVEWKTIGELFDFKNGLNKDKSAFGSGIPFVKYMDVYKNKKIKKSLLTGKVQLTEKEIESFGLKKGDVLFTRCSETKEEVGFASAVTEDLGDCAFNGFVLRARPKTDLLLPDYCAYCFRTYEVRSEIIRTCSFTTRANTTGVILSKIKIPVPPLSEQERIVAILDRFESLCNDITQGLPAEIEARRKQYEYYRDKLLTFRKISTTA